MFEIGKKYTIKRDKPILLYLQTRDGKTVNLYSNETFIKIKDTFTDKIVGRNMFKLEHSYIELDLKSIEKFLEEV